MLFNLSIYRYNKLIEPFYFQNEDCIIVQLRFFIIQTEKIRSWKKIVCIAVVKYSGSQWTISRETGIQKNIAILRGSISLLHYHKSVVKLTRNTHKKSLVLLVEENKETRWKLVFPLQQIFEISNARKWCFFKITSNKQQLSILHAFNKQTCIHVMQV